MNSLRIRWAAWRARQAELPFYRQTGFIGSAIFVAIVLLAGLILLITGLGDDGPETPAAGTSGTQQPATPSGADDEETTTGDTAAPTTTAAPPVAEGDCPPLETSSGTDALTVAPEVEWSPVGDAPTAWSPVEGPATNEGATACYAHTAAGALLAAHNFTAVQNDSLVPLMESVEARVAPDGPIHDELLADAESEGTRGGTAIAPVAYRFINVDADEYTVAVIYEVPDQTAAAYVEIRTVVRWLDGDWLIWDMPSGNQVPSVPAGYIEWGPYVDAEE